MEPATVIPIESVPSLSLFRSFARARVTLTHFVHVKAESSSRCLSLHRLSRVFVFFKPLRLYQRCGYTRRTSARPPYAETCDKTVSEIQRKGFTPRADGRDLHLVSADRREGERKTGEKEQSTFCATSLFTLNDA